MTLPNFSSRLRHGIATGFLVLALVGPAFGLDSLPQGHPDESNLDRHGYYTNRSGHEVHQPAKSDSGAVPVGATAKCRDGDYSFSEHHSGTCSGHGGVGQWLR
jgi:uncharacterized protein DUF3761